ncbi:MULTISPECIES: HAD family hydrolase [unclassified Prochlorococcus]|uniref:HAD family hydrolase n=1 Tax=unclassified Prochlorococcus TaxID=2627481 RepID=UPI0005339B64|nr:MULTISPECIES: HAD family phosphatase [unclassified Prochlorococcus]KGG15365.1 HAD- hydrolase subfamily IA [Prochlorococcus sp. MIT 0602]KGG17643.1 HAD- hydrolase subfamily IA [Prochlorococcus sp. MIT 0603]
MILPKAFLFDLDGVLIDSEPLNKLAWKKLANQFGLNISDKKLNKLLGRRKIECAKILQILIKEPVSIDKLLKYHRKIHTEILKDVKATKGAEQIVRWRYKNNIKTALITSSTEESVAYKTRRYDWIDLIQTRIYGDNPKLQNSKPEPDPYILGAKLLNENPNSCWAIEDSEIGVTSALKAGCVVWLITNKYISIENIAIKYPKNNLHIVQSLIDVLNEAEIASKY